MLVIQLQVFNNKALETVISVLVQFLTVIVVNLNLGTNTNMMLLKNANILEGILLFTL